MSETNPFPPGSKDEALKMAYQEVCTSYHAVADFRAKLLGLLPLVSGVGIFFLLSDPLADTSKRVFTSQFLLPIGIFGCVVTLGLFFYELRGIQQCNRLIKVGKRIEIQLGIKGQFFHRPPRIGIKGQFFHHPPRIAGIGSGSIENDTVSENTTSSEHSDANHPPQVSHYPGIIGNTLAAQVIYSAVFAAWVFVALVFLSPQGVWWITPLVFVVFLAVSYAFDLKAALEEEQSDHKEPPNPKAQETLE